MQHVLCNEHCGCASVQHLVAIVACACGRRHVEMRCVDMWRLQLSCMSHPVAIFACLVHTARGSIVALSALHPGHSCRFSFRVAVQHLQSADNWPKVSCRYSKLCKLIPTIRRLKWDLVSVLRDERNLVDAEVRLYYMVTKITSVACSVKKTNH